MSAIDQKRCCHYTEQQVRESQLLSPERMTEVSAAIDARISSAYDADGREIPQAKVATLGPDGRLLFARLDGDSAVEYMRRTLLPHVLTDDELTLVNNHCSSAWKTSKEKSRFEKAEKVKTWDSFVYHDDHYAASVEELLCRFDSEAEWPEYVWATEPTVVIPSLDVSDVVEHHVCERGWEDMDTDDLEGVAELQAALDRFVEANKGVCSYHPDYKKAVLLSAWRKPETKPGE